MDLTKQFDKFKTLWAELETSAKLTFTVVAVGLVAGFAYLMFYQASTGLVPISAGKAFSVEEAMHAEQTLLSAGLDKFKLRGGQLLVPRGQAERYNAALIAGGGLPSNWAEEWENQMTGLGQFAGSRQRAMTVENARAKMVATYISQLPDVAFADVIFDEDKQPGFRAIGKTRATVFLRPKPGRVLDQSVVTAVRLAVANSKKHLSPDDVAVMDITGQKTYDGSGKGGFGDETLMRINHFTAMYEQRVAAALSYIPGVVVTANVNLERLRESVVRKQQINPKETVAVVGNTTRNSDNMQKAAPAAEPGGGPNVNLNLATSAGGGQSREVTQNSEQTVSTASFEITESSIEGGLAESVTMSVSIPKSYYRAIALKDPTIQDKSSDITESEIDAVAKQVETDIIAQVEAKVQNLLPLQKNPDPNVRMVIVDSISILETPEQDVSVPFTVTAKELTETYGRPLGMVIVALAALFFLNKSLSRPLPELPELKLPTAVEDSDEEEEKKEELPDLFTPPENKKRETFEQVTRERPEFTASVIANWVSTGGT